MNHHPLSTFLAGCLLAALASPALGDADEFAQALSERLDLRAEGLEVDGHPAFVLMPPESKRRTPQPWILYAPTLPAYPDRHEAWMHQQFVAAGVAVAGVDMGEAYGSPRGQAGMSALYKELVERRGFAPRPCLLGRSRGGLWVTSWAGKIPDKVAGIAGIYSVFDLRSYPGLDKAAPAYELTPAELESQLATHNPIEQAATLAQAGVRVFIIHGEEDELVPIKANADELVKRYKSAGAEKLVTLRRIPDEGHNVAQVFFRSQELVDFAIERAKAGAANVEMTNDE